MSIRFVYESITFTKLRNKWFKLFTVGAYPDSCYQSEESKNFVRTVITAKELKKFLLAVAVSWPMLPSAVCLPSNDFLYQLLKCLKDQIIISQYLAIMLTQYWPFKLVCEASTSN